MSLPVVKYGLLSFPAVSFGLGVWQIKRLEWKKGVIAEMEQRLNGEPIDLLSIESVHDLDKFDYRRIKVKGTFDSNVNRQVIIKPAQLVVNDEALFRGKTAHQSNTGAFVITPFKIEGTNLWILINRGWLPLKGKESIANSMHVGIENNQLIEVTGILRLSDKRPRYGLRTHPGAREWPIRDVEGIAKTINTAPIYIDADEKLSSGVGPIGGQTRVSIRNEHLSYIVTWFALSAFSFFMWYKKYGGRASISTRTSSY